VPELPDLTVYVEALERFVGGERLERVRLASPSLLRSVDPPLSEAGGRRVRCVRRVAKRIAIGLEPDLFLVFHLMIAGRFHWRRPGASTARKTTLAAFDFARGTLLLTEAGSKRRASLHLARGESGLAAHDPGGLEVMESGEAAFAEALRRESHTCKRALTDPRLFAGIGNAYSDEILHRARLSPVALTRKLDDEQVGRLHRATRATLSEWIERLRAETGDGFPEKVTAFRPEMAVHGRFGKPCPDCGAPVQRIVYAENETNYCAPCQTGGRLLADRALSRLLKRDWPRSLDEMDQRLGRSRPDA
jgi:formamidopyrimidine-DNA glycosylase